MSTTGRKNHRLLPGIAACCLHPLKAGLRSPTLRESKKPPATIERVSFSPKKSTALITVTSGSSVDTKEAFAAPILPSPAKNDQKATTVEKNAIASVAVTPKALSGSDTPLERAMHKYDTEALRIMKALPAIVQSLCPPPGS